MIWFYQAFLMHVKCNLFAWEFQTVYFKSIFLWTVC